MWKNLAASFHGFLGASLACFLAIPATAARLSLPPRAPDAPSASALLVRTANLPLAEREEILATEFLQGNVPEFLRNLQPVKISSPTAGKISTVVLQVTPDYLAVGSDSDYCLIPLSPGTAQRIANATGCILPTPAIVDAIYQAAALKLAPQPIPPSALMTTMHMFSNHNAIVLEQRRPSLAKAPPGTLVAGHKKDVVLSARLKISPGKVAIYGWHQTNGVPIQTLYLGHTEKWVDYSHGIRLVLDESELNGQKRKASEILSDPGWAAMLSNEGPLEGFHYPLAPATTLGLASSLDGPAAQNSAKTTEWSPPNQFGERTRELQFKPGVRVHVNVPDSALTNTSKPLALVFYALPNGNSIEQTIGKRTVPADDWHFNIQHIGAQMRFVRSLQTNQTWAIAYLENTLKAWPAWRRKHGDTRIPAILKAVEELFSNLNRQIVLTGHSGGGSLVFGYINTLEHLPAKVTRIAFLDSNYAYDPGLGHDRKLTDWLKNTTDAQLSVFAYHDSHALLNGTNFVSASGGTWGRSHAMLDDLGKHFAFQSTTNNGLRVHCTADRSILFLLKENPEKRILHTTQVELNGFIHALLLRTPFEDTGYDYFGKRAYEIYIADR